MSAPLSYGVDGAAKAIGISARGVWRLIHDGELPTFKLGARTLILTEDLQALLHRRKHERAA